MSLKLVIDVPKVGKTLIDCDHAELARRMHSVRLALRSRRPERILKSLQSLREFSLTHFGLEEGIMAAAHYPLAENHARAHQRLIGVVNQAIGLSQASTRSLSPKTIEAIEELHGIHIATDDARFDCWLNRTPA